MSTLKTHNLQSPDAGSVNIALASNAGMVVAGISTFNNNVNVSGTIETTGSELKITGAEPRLTFTDTDNNPDFQIWANAQKFAIYDSTNSATRFHIDSSGKIGINASSPVSMLDVLESSTTQSETDKRIATFRKQGTTVGDEGYIHLTTMTGHYGIKLGYRNEGGSPGYLNQGFFISTVNNGENITNHVKRFVIKSDGKVGFGTDSPDQTVHIHKGSAGSVSSTANTVLTLENSTTNVLQFLNPNNTAAQVRFGDPEDDGIGFIEYSHNANTMSFGVYGPTRMQLDSNGHLGIAVASVTQLANSKQLTLRPSDDDGIRLIRPGDGNNNPNIHLDLTTTTSGSAFPSGEAYTTKYKTMNCDQIFETYEGGGTGGHISFRTRSSSGETFRIDKDGHVSLRNTASSHQEIQWYRNTNKYASIGWGDGSANWEFKHFRADNQADNPYANIDFFTGSTTSPTRALRITEDGNHIREKHSRFATRIDYNSGTESPNSKLNFQNAHVNVGNDFNGSNDRFTAPVDGDYAFWFHTNVEKSGGGSYYATWYKNGSEANGSHGGRMYDQHSGSGWNNLSGCIMLPLQEGDYVEVYNGGQTVNYDGNSYGQFMGWLVG